jgi:hypothetical protein
MITSYDRLQPMDEQGDYPIKVLIMAPLIMVSLLTVSSFSTRGCFLRGGWSPSRDPPPLSSLWMASWCEWLSPCRWWCLQGFRVENLSGARKGGPNRPPKWAGLAGLGRPDWAHLGPVQSPLRSSGSSCNYALCPLHLHDFDNVILASKMEVLFAWSSVFYASIPGGVPRSTVTPWNSQFQDVNRENN